VLGGDSDTPIRSYKSIAYLQLDFEENGFFTSKGSFEHLYKNREINHGFRILQVAESSPFFSENLLFNSRNHAENGVPTGPTALEIWINIGGITMYSTIDIRIHLHC